MPLRGLTVVLIDPARLRAALELTAATAALGGRARLFCQGAAVAALRAPLAAEDDAAHAAVGLPRLAELADTALGLGVALLACQSGLALTGLSLTALATGVEAGGLVGLLAELGEDRLTVV